MTHDELLAKIDGNWIGEVANSDLAIALRAVVELHRPLRFDWSNPQLCCKSCRDLDGDDFARALYPCPTIQAIEKELA